MLEVDEEDCAEILGDPHAELKRELINHRHVTEENQTSTALFCSIKFKVGSQLESDKANRKC